MLLHVSLFLVRLSRVCWVSVGLPVIELLGYVQMLQMVVNGPLVLLQKGIGVPKTVTRLSLHHLVSKLPGQLQCFPKVHEMVQNQNRCDGTFSPLGAVVVLLTGSTPWPR